MPRGSLARRGLSLQLGATVTLYAKKADYVSTAKRLKATQPKVKDLKINVLLLSEARFPIKGYLNPADDDLIVVSGYVTDPTGAPAPQPTKPTPTPKSAANNRWKPSPAPA